MKRTNTLTSSEVTDRIKHTLLCESIPTYKWMYDLGLNSTQLGVYAYIFNVCRREPMAEHYIKTMELAELFHVTPQNLQQITSTLVSKGLVYKRIIGRGNQSKPYYSLYTEIAKGVDGACVSIIREDNEKKE